MTGGVGQKTDASTRDQIPKGKTKLPVSKRV
jgi:hypothetical protein